MCLVITELQVYQEKKKTGKNGILLVNSPFARATRVLWGTGMTTARVCSLSLLSPCALRSAAPTDGGAHHLKKLQGRGKKSFKIHSPCCNVHFGNVRSVLSSGLGRSNKQSLKLREKQSQEVQINK